MKIGTQVKIRVGAQVGQDMRFYSWPEDAADVIFKVEEQIPDEFFGVQRFKLRAPGYGLLPDAYGCGCVYVYEKDLIELTEDEQKMSESEAIKEGRLKEFSMDFSRSRKGIESEVRSRILQRKQMDERPEELARTIEQLKIRNRELEKEVEESRSFLITLQNILNNDSRYIKKMIGKALRKEE